jgi:hypothetical protein
MQDIRDRLGSKGQSVKESVREPEKESVTSSKRKAQVDSSHQRREVEFGGRILSKEDILARSVISVEWYKYYLL